ncbi:hypothetical protein M3I54_04380 [Paraburkholderia sp. CNPSo 3274]|uniref:hypothetical protein n=1 Tax=Paraburkholderia sp. CNPSo 3274 TaxID=2940932 RepID=UPI0020B727E4|nr:hypothetical protein [Paraburkholderia sp. CNPSo 3274]MCP3706227.1 hypothetical protein [Paraburkholderia sp. CNPSo 3274]
MKKNHLIELCVFIFALLPVVAHCEISEEVYCFDSNGTGSKNFGLHVLYDDAENWSIAFVKYRGVKSVITLVSKSEESEGISSGRPDQVITAWYEVYGGKIAGEYEMMSQGANIYSMTYENYGTRKKTAFLFNPEAIGKNGRECVW